MDKKTSNWFPTWAAPYWQYTFPHTPYLHPQNGLFNFTISIEKKNGEKASVFCCHNMPANESNMQVGEYWVTGPTPQQGEQEHLLWSIF